MFCRKALTALFLSLCLLGNAPAAESLAETETYLLDYVAHADVKFIRNGTAHTPAEAVEHMKAKRDHFKADIKTPEDFIRLAASKSLLTGQAYLIRTPDGKETPLSEWLTDILRRHRESAKS